jgi:hypothetical protein
MFEKSTHWNIYYDDDAATKLYRMQDIDLDHALLNVIRVFIQHNLGEDDFAGLMMRPSYLSKGGIYTEVLIHRDGRMKSFFG